MSTAVTVWKGSAVPRSFQVLTIAIAGLLGGILAVIIMATAVGGRGRHTRG